MAALLGALTGWLHLAALVLALGTVAARWILVPRAASSFPEAGDALAASAARLGRLAAGALAIAMALVFVRQLVEFRDPYALWSEDASLLMTGTDWGRTWMSAAVMTLVAAGAFALVQRGHGAAWWVGSLAVVGLAAYPAFSGHASGTEGLRSLTITADVLHVLAAGLWVGGLAFVLYAERSWRVLTARAAGSVLPALVPVFSPLAMGAVATLIVTGSVGAWVQLESIGDLVAIPYGRLLLAKLALVLLVMVLGAVNWRRLIPRLGEEAGQGALRRNAAAELFFAQIVLLVTAVLVRTSPLGH